MKILLIHCLHLFGERINENKEKLLKVDYSIIHEILYINVSGDKKTKKSSRDCNNVTGEPLEVFLSAVLSALTEAKAQEIPNLATIEIEFKEAEIATGFSDNDDDEKENCSYPCVESNMCSSQWINPLY